jgi:hypothetical protein
MASLSGTAAEVASRLAHAGGGPFKIDGEASWTTRRPRHGVMRPRSRAAVLLPLFLSHTTVELSTLREIEKFWDRKEDLVGERWEILRSQYQCHSEFFSITNHKSSTLKQSAGREIRERNIEISATKIQHMS